MWEKTEAENECRSKPSPSSNKNALLLDSRVAIRSTRVYPQPLHVAQLIKGGRVCDSPLETSSYPHQKGEKSHENTFEIAMEEERVEL